MENLRAALANFVRSNVWEHVEVRGKRWIETVGTDLKLPVVTSAEIKQLWPSFDLYIAEARSEYILSKVSQRLSQIAEIIKHDPGTRRAYVYKPDWYWEKHPACILYVQFLLRRHKLLSLVCIRSSNLYNALPYDIHAVDFLASYIISKLDLFAEKGEQIYHFGSAHVPENKWREFLSNLGVSEEEVNVVASAGRAVGAPRR